MDWEDWKNDIADKLYMDVSDPSLELQFPLWAQDVELRLQRDLNLVDASVTDTSTTVTPNSRNYAAPMVSVGSLTYPKFVVIEQLTVLSPVGAPSATSVRNRLLPVSKEFLDVIAPSDQAPTTPSIPRYVCPLGSGTFLLGPAPDAAYTMELYGDQRFVPLGSDQPTNFLSIFFPDLYKAATMVYAAGWKQNFGQASDNPQMAVSWNAVYMELLKGASAEEARKKYIETGWNPPAPAAAPATPEVA